MDHAWLGAETCLQTIILDQYLLKASMASKGVITGAKNSLLSNRAVCAQDTKMNTSHCKQNKKKTGHHIYISIAAYCYNHNNSYNNYYVVNILSWMAISR